MSINDLIIEYKKETKKDCYKIEIQNGTPSILDNKIGGIPYLPMSESYPLDEEGLPMTLLLQINLKDIDLPYWSNHGILEIYVDKNLSWPCKYEIKYFEENLNYTKDIKVPENNDSNLIIGTPLKITLKKEICHMPISDYRYESTIINIVNKIYNKNLKDYKDVLLYFNNNFDFIYELSNSLKTHAGNIGGYPDFTQEDPRKFDRNIENKKDECLFKIDSNLDENLMIGDMGIIFGLINKNDLKSNNFTNGIIDWDCC